jgi:hypothetical protein
MSEARRERAVVDRFEGSYAVLLIGESRRLLDVPRQQLPPHTREGTWLQIEVRDDQLVAAALDDDATDTARRRIQEKQARLRRGDHLKDAT